MFLSKLADNTLIIFKISNTIIVFVSCLDVIHKICFMQEESMKSNVRGLPKDERFLL